MIEDKINKIGNSKIGASMFDKYMNKVAINGFLLQQPKFFDKGGGKVIGAFLIHQINKSQFGENTDMFFSGICFIPEIVDRLRELKHVAFITMVARIDYSYKTNKLQLTVYDFVVDREFDEELDPPYQWKGN